VQARGLHRRAAARVTPWSVSIPAIGVASTLVPLGLLPSGS
jgi:hypothetical protein